MLRKAPLLSVDLEGNVSLRGSKNIKFLVNGKASSFFSSDISTALQMIPAEQIKTIEVITSPGAKYDGEGDAGIVNIITKKTVINGYNGSINTNIGTKVTRSGINLNIGKKRFGLSARAGMYGSWPGRIGTDQFNRTDWDSLSANGTPINTNTLNQNGKSENYFQGYRGSINTFYDINAYQSINSSLKFGGKTKPIKTNTNVNYINASDTLKSYTSEYISSKTDRSLNIEWTTDFTKKFSDSDDRELTFALQLGGDLNDSNTEIEENEQNIFNQNDEKVIEETFQIDYTHSLGSKEKVNKQQDQLISKGENKETKGKRKFSRSLSTSNKIEIGGKIINRDREIVYSDQINNLYVNSEEFNYNQLVVASYISSELSLPAGFGLKTGVRFEYTGASGSWKNNSYTPFKNNYSSVLPNMILSKSFSPLRSIKFSYNQRIRRPNVRQINTNTDKIDNRNITVGNPSLKPTITDQYELAINSFGRIIQTSIQLYYKHSLNVIEKFLDNVEEGVSVATYKNIGESRQIGANIFGSIKLKKFNFRGSLDIYKYSGRDSELGYRDWTKPVILYSYFMGGSYDLGKNWKAETFGFYRSPTQSIQGTITSFSMMSFGIKKLFKNKKGSIGIRIIEPFKKNKNFTSDLNGDFFAQSSLRSIPFRSFAISFKYSIGKLKFKNSNKQTNIKNDDIQEDQNNDF